VHVGTRGKSLHCRYEFNRSHSPQNRLGQNHQRRPEPA
jgi:hypothetical protein